MQTETQPYNRVGQYQAEPPPPNNQKGLSAASVLLPLRLFLGVSFIAAGLDKLTDKDFLDPTAITYIGNQLAAFSKQSPIGGFLTSVAVPNATIFGALVMAGELAIGLGTLVGLFSRTAAFFGFLLSMTLWLTATWEVAPFFLGSDLPYAIGWLTLALAGAHPIFSLDGQLRKWLAQRRQSAAIVEGAPVGSALYQNDAASLNLNSPEDQATLARRRFITVAGATVLVGAVSGLAWKNSLDSKNQAAQASAEGQASSAVETPTPAASATVTSAPTTAPATSIPTTAPAVASTTVPANNTNANASTTAATTTQPTPAPATATSKPTTAAPTTTQAAPKAPTTVAAAKGPVLAALSSIAVGDAKAFTTPDTKQPAYLVHLADGSVKAFSAICTHEGCEVSYSKSNKLFVCPCHGAQFNATTGAVVRSPARTALKSYKVQVDNGNIIYVQG